MPCPCCESAKGTGKSRSLNPRSAPNAEAGAQTEKFVTYLRVAVAAVGPGLPSVAAAESAAFPVGETKAQRSVSLGF